MEYFPHLSSCLHFCWRLVGRGNGVRVACWDGNREREREREREVQTAEVSVPRDRQKGRNELPVPSEVFSASSNRKVPLELEPFPRADK